MAPGTVKVIRGEGMPLQKKPNEKGNLKVCSGRWEGYRNIGRYRTTGPLPNPPPPQKKHPHNKQVKFNIAFPTQLSSAQKQAVKQALAGVSYPNAPPPRSP